MHGRKAAVTEEKPRLGTTPRRGTKGAAMNRFDQEINVIALCKGNERYVWMYHDRERANTLRHIGETASNPELSFTWYDAACLSQRIREARQSD